MSTQELRLCLRLLRAADAILMDRREYRIAAHLSMAVDLLERRAPDR